MNSVHARAILVGNGTVLSLSLTARIRAVGRGGGINADHSYEVRTIAIGKGRWEESPYLLANEWISANIAQLLRLPVPPFALVRKSAANTAMFISHSYEGDTTPDDAEPRVLYGRFPGECAGITLLDILIANCDRGRHNLKVDNPNDPGQFYIIDHERALFYVNPGGGIARLESRRERLGVSDDSGSHDEWHCLLPLIDRIGDIREWIQKINLIPDFYIDDICDEARNLSATREECEAASSF